jgi:hypothetical protein
VWLNAFQWRVYGRLVESVKPVPLNHGRNGETTTTRLPSRIKLLPVVGVGFANLFPQLGQ